MINLDGFGWGWLWLIPGGWSVAGYKRAWWVLVDGGWFRLLVYGWLLLGFDGLMGGRLGG